MNRRVLISTLFILYVTILTGCQSLPESDSKNAKLYVAKCSGCHKAPSPADHPYKLWDRLFTMMERGYQHPDMPPLSQKEWLTIREYFQKYALPDPENPSKP
ncbi:MAG: hypothetical protein A2V90_04980 [Gammaproteobacteria bacterium RBG_16_57_12]|nr:MAG: hypothetical protein A2V90_04980 [Gammaproteobacteria bacterium RBG_16_57_12]